MKLNYKRTFIVGLAFLSICAFWQVYDNVIPLILTNTFHLNETFSGAIMAVDYLPYVFYVIINVKLGSFLIGQGALTDIVKNTKNTEKFYTELAKIV